MGKIDIALKELFNINDIFTDLFNGTIFSGESVLENDQLENIDTNSTLLLEDSQTGKVIFQQRYRDVVKKCDTKYLYSTFGIENQSDIHYAMPQRIMLYDALTYTEEAQASRQESEALGKKIPYTQGIEKGKYLLPVLSIVVYTGKTPWNGPRSLYELCGFNEEECIRAKAIGIQDYRIRIIETAHLSNEEIENYHSDLKTMFLLLNEKETRKSLQNKEISLPMNHRETAVALDVLTNSKKFTKFFDDCEKKEENDMRGLLGVIEADAKKDGRREGKREERLENVKKLMKNTGNSFNEVCKLLDIVGDEKEELKKLL